MTLKALVFSGKKNIRFETVPDPVPDRPDDVIVQVELCAICGSDLHPYHGREQGLDVGTVMGHEFVGTVVEAGKKVRRLCPGDRVFSPFTSNCGRCFFCRNGLTCRCVHGQLFGWRQERRGLHGAQAEFVCVPLAESTLLKVPEDVATEEALLLGDVLATGYFCAENAGLQKGQSAAVIGCGPVGLMAVVAACEKRAHPVFAIDSVPYRLQLAEAFGAIPLNYTSEQVHDIVRQQTEGRGVDAALEVVGSPEAMRTAVDLVRPGGVVSTVGVHTESTFVFSPVEAYDKNLTFRIGRCPARVYMEKLIPFVRQRRYDLTRIISHRMPLDQGPQAYRIFDQKLDNCTKIVLTP